eukprot:NODE_1969_length_1734_cov_19.841092_g1678_i0.p1 GENE.NODE_1969_length_1734_cov_19.841092_g1678_i0~~NODE_1969_length_1734_cov_19.841092_g1678_i0.p1  ORF type:complete len:546 (-),score=136.76 NODE_1969_length_1734_cov_19.841092_g1678_i0:96-1577(-)
MALGWRQQYMPKVIPAGSSLPKPQPNSYTPPAPTRPATQVKLEHKPYVTAPPVATTIATSAAIAAVADESMPDSEDPYTPLDNFQSVHVPQPGPSSSFEDESMPESPLGRGADEAMPDQPLEDDMLAEVTLNAFRGSDIDKAIHQQQPITSIIGNLDISDCGLDNLPDSMLKMPNLRTLKINENKLETLPPLGKYHPRLTYLDCSSNPVNNFSSAVEGLHELRTLLAYKMKLKLFPSDICNFLRLENLNMFDNGLTRVPEEINQLVSLQELNLASNQITSLPDRCFANLSELTRLALFWNKLSHVPSMEDLICLQKLELHSNQLKEVPKMAMHPYLQELYLGTNHLTSLPAEMFRPDYLPKLEQLMVGSNRLTSVPAEIAKLPSISKLVLSSNQLSELPEPIYYIPTLTFLDISSNKFEIIPDVVGAGKDRMITLFLADNKLTTLPESLASFTVIKRFSIKKNKINLQDPTTAKVYNTLEALCTANEGKFVGL